MLERLSCLDHLKEYLGKEGVAYEVTLHPARFTAQELAQVEHVPGRLIAKVVMVMADEKLVMVVVAGPSKVSLPAVKQTLGARHVRLCVQTNADAFSGGQSHRRKSQSLRSLSGRKEGNRDF